MAHLSTIGKQSLALWGEAMGLYRYTMGEQSEGWGRLRGSTGTLWANSQSRGGGRLRWSNTSTLWANSQRRGGGLYTMGKQSEDRRGAAGCGTLWAYPRLIEGGERRQAVLIQRLDAGPAPVHISAQLKLSR